MAKNMMAKTFFVTGTDTDAGKTLVACALLSLAKRSGLTTAAVKPVAAGCEKVGDSLRNADALALQAQCNPALLYEQINPVAFLPAIAPHIAAQQSGREITVNRLVGLCRGVTYGRAALTVIEGAGGWRVPLNTRETLADLARELNHPIILVVGMKLGCINHALLTYEAIVRDGLVVAGWVANCVQPHMDVLEQNLATLIQRLPAPCLGVVPHLTPATAEAAAEHLNLSLLDL